MAVLPALRRAANLRILFCGSDSFSATSLARLRSEMQSNPELISSIEVLTRDEKPSGRGMKTQREIPTATYATENELKLHQITTFTGWELPSPVDLIIAVSFGLFVPPRILGVVKYGGINVHPSLLPRYRGAAPIHHAVANGDAYTGVTVQTLDPREIDHGRILAQSGRIPIDYSRFAPEKFSWTEPQGSLGHDLKDKQEDNPFTELHGALADKGADLLVNTVRKGLFMPTKEEGKTPAVSLVSEEEPSEASKMEKEHARLLFKDLRDPSEAVRLSWVMGHVFCPVHSAQKHPQRRALFYGLEEVTKPEGDVKESVWRGTEAGTFFTLRKLFMNLKPELFTGLNKKDKKRKSALYADDERGVIKLQRGWLSFRKAKMASGKEDHGSTWVRNYKYAGYYLC